MNDEIYDNYKAVKEDECKKSDCKESDKRDLKISIDVRNYIDSRLNIFEDKIKELIQSEQKLRISQYNKLNDKMENNYDIQQRKIEIAYDKLKLLGNQIKGVDSRVDTFLEKVEQYRQEFIADSNAEHKLVDSLREQVNGIQNKKVMRGQMPKDTKSAETKREEPIPPTAYSSQKAMEFALQEYQKKIEHIEYHIKTILEHIERDRRQNDVIGNKLHISHNPDVIYHIHWVESKFKSLLKILQ